MSDPVDVFLLLPSLLYVFPVFQASPADPAARLPQESER